MNADRGRRDVALTLRESIGTSAEVGSWASAEDQALSDESDKADEKFLLSGQGLIDQPCQAH